MFLGSMRRHRLGNDPFRMAGQHLAAGNEATTAGIAGVPLVNLLGHLHGEFGVLFVGQRFAAESHLFRVEHDHEVAAIDVRRVVRFVLAHQDHRQMRRQSAHKLGIGVNDIPFRRDILFADQSRRMRRISLEPVAFIANPNRPNPIQVNRLLSTGGSSRRQPAQRTGHAGFNSGKRKD